MGGGIERLEESVRPTGSLIPPGCTWFKSKVVEFNPDKNIVVTADGKEVSNCDILCQFFSARSLSIQWYNEHFEIITPFRIQYTFLTKALLQVLG